MENRQYWVVAWREPHLWDRLCAFLCSTAEEADQWVKTNRPNATDVCKYITLTEEEYHQMETPKNEPDERKYIWTICEDCHGIVGYWDTRAGAVAEVERLNKSAGLDAEDKLCWDDEDFYGYEFVNAHRIELNEQW